MKTLNETQLQVLEAAAKTGASPEGLHPRTVASLIKQGLIAERRGRGGKSNLVATPSGLALLQEQRLGRAKAAEKTKSRRKAQASQPSPEAAKPKAAKAAAPAQPPAREAQGKLGLLIDLLRRPDGATLEAMVAATGWQAHSVRGAMAGAIKKKLGLTVVSEKPGPVRTWRIVEARA